MRPRYIILGLALFLGIGTLWYHFMEGMKFIDAFYMAVITITTVGFREVKPLSPEGKLFTVFYLFLGLGFISYSFFSIGERIFEGTLKNMLERRKMREIEKLRDHYIICGFGRMGRFAVRELLKKKVPMVVVDNSQDAVEELKEKGIPYILGDARLEEVLISAGIERARAIACLLRSDADNLYTVFTAKELNPEIFVVSRAEDEISCKKLLKAGADKVILPYEEGGVKIAQTLLRPTLLEFFDLIIQKEHVPLEVDELRLTSSSQFLGKTLKDSGIRQKYGMIAIAVRKKGNIIFNPDPELVLEEGDSLILIGERKMFEKLFRDELSG